MNSAAEKWQQTEMSLRIAADHADADSPKWSDRAFDLLMRFARLRGGDFCADQVHDWAIEQGLPQPPTRQAWGSVMLKASRQGLIRKTGIRNHHYPNHKNTHTRPTAFWIRVIPTSSLPGDIDRREVKS